MHGWFIFVVMAVVAVLTIFVAINLLMHYQHPDDRGSAWVVRIVTVAGICLSIWVVLLFPLDVANSQSCKISLPVADCSVVLPMKRLWYAAYFLTAAWAIVLTPFFIFYYEGDSEWTVGRKIASGLAWSVGSFILFSIGVGLAYWSIGYAIYPVQTAWSGVIPLAYLPEATSGGVLVLPSSVSPAELASSLSPPTSATPSIATAAGSGGTTPLALDSCVQPLASVDQSVGTRPWSVNASLVEGGTQCDARLLARTETWKLRVTFPVYLMATLSTLGWCLFAVLGGIGLVAVPLDLFRDFAGRPRKSISREEYHERARRLGQAAGRIAEEAAKLRAAEREGRRGRFGWKRKVTKLAGALSVLEDEQRLLERDYPQGEDREARWVLMALWYWLKLPLGVVAAGLSVSWVLQVVLYRLVRPPVTPFLSAAFARANDVFPLFGTLLFAIWVFYLQIATATGTFKFGLNLLVFRVHPMRAHGTPIGSILFNVALLLLSATATVQFSAQAFASYADASTIKAVLGTTLTSLVGLRWLYIRNGFMYLLLVVSALTVIVLSIRGKRAWKRQGLADIYAE